MRRFVGGPNVDDVVLANGNDDGVRLNIRPFAEAKVLREIPKGIHWNKDRGSDVASAPWFDLGLRYGGMPGDRINDHHLTLAEKQAARERVRQ